VIFKPRGTTLTATAGVLIAAMGFANLFTRPWSLSAQLPALVLLLVGGTVFAAGRLTGTARPKSIVVMLSVVAALYAWELFLTLNLPVLLQRVLHPQHDRRSKREVTLDLRHQGDMTAVPMAHPSFLIFYPQSIPKPVRRIIDSGFLPLGAISDRTTVLCNESGKYAIYRADEHGFRNPRGAWSVPPRVAVVGDSFSHGHCVDDGEDWVGVMRRSVPQVLNLGVGGNGPLFMLATLREYVRVLQPPIVIWQYFEGHDGRIPGELKVPVLRRYLEEPGYSQGLVGRQAEIDALVEQIVRRALREPDTSDWALIELEKLLKLSSLRDALTVVPPAEPTANLPVLARVLLEAKHTVESWGGKMYFVYLPELAGLKPGPPSRHASHDQVVALVHGLDLEVVDLYPVFRSHPDPLSIFPYRKAFHYNAAGYAIVANTVLKGIARGVDGPGAVHGPQ
jgi:hypothetical protein